MDAIVKLDMLIDQMSVSHVFHHVKIVQVIKLFAQVVLILIWILNQENVNANLII